MFGRPQGVLYWWAFNGWPLVNMIGDNFGFQTDVVLAVELLRKYRIER
jgi:hypothetical protein